MCYICVCVSSCYRWCFYDQSLLSTTVDTKFRIPIKMIPFRYKLSVYWEETCWVRKRRWP